MTREFVITQEFDKNWKAMGLTDNELRQLQEELIANPKNVMQCKEQAVCENFA